MTPDVIAAALRLANVLELENAALTAFDLPRAATLLSEKAEALEAFTSAKARARQGSVGTLDASQRRMAEALTVRLRRLAEENKMLLDRALFVQNRVISIFARAMPRALAAQTSRYGANGGWASTASPPALALRSRA